MLRRQIREGGFSVTLLEGVTGSGKTEVYFEAVAESLRAGRQALILMPEIALTTQFVQRFEARFGARPGEWHSGVPQKRKGQLLAGVAGGETRVVIGARSALMLPFARLGLIVVDEEHEAGYKQEDGVVYHARDMAVVRARLEQAATVLVSATPSIETRVNVETGRYRRVLLPDRVAGRPLPDIAAIDLRRSPPAKDRWLSPAARHRHRRGACGGRADASLPEPARLRPAHALPRLRAPIPLPAMLRLARRASLHPLAALPSLRASRKAAGRLPRMRRHRHAGGLRSWSRASRRGGGVAIFPKAASSCSRATCPAAPKGCGANSPRSPKAKADIVIGTQLIAKGHDFKRVALVGVVDGDIGLAGSDPRANERTFQLLRQVAGRAGRGETSGRALIQTYDPASPVMSAMLSGDAERFYESEIAARRAAGMPPFGRLASLIVSARRAEEALATCSRARAGGPSPHRAGKGAEHLFLGRRTRWCSARPRRRSR